ncbi:MAG: hypothetical protein M1840_008924 [Geoglossum simile]|nr:MAG: hypothetical protein M1840_008924 [Geoglossum simile]
MDPIQIGSSFIYYVKSENRGNGLHTHDSTFIACEMRREKLVYTHHYPDVLLGAKDFRLFSLKGHEYLILVDSWRLRRRSKDGVGEIAIIDGATGNITQTLKWGGSSLNVIAKPNSFTFALCYSPGGNTKFGFTRIYSQKQDGTFSCDSAVAVQNPWASDYAFNPFTLRGYTIFPGRDVYTISLRKRFMPDVPRRLEVGSEGFCLIMQSSVTLPPKESGVKRRLCKNNAFANVDCGRMAMIGVTGTRVAFFAENTMFIFDFGAPW